MVDFCKLTGVGDYSPLIASFEIDRQDRTSRLLHHVCLRSFDKARMVGGAMAEYGVAGSIIADNQCSHLIELHLVRPDTFARFRRRIVLNIVRGTGLTIQATRPGPQDHRLTAWQDQ